MISPIYFLMGEEPYYIDKIADYIDENVLKEEEKGFNQMTLYGRDTTINDIVANAKRYPMMAERQVIIVKEAQDLARTIENLTDYVANMQPTTVLVMCYKYKKLDARKKLSKTIRKHGVLFESKKLYDNQVANWIKRFLAQKNYKIEPKAAEMLVDFLGNNLSKISNELTKLAIVLPENSLISPEEIEKNIGISKDFNIFELRKAICNKNLLKANQIINYFAKNDKANPLVLNIGMLNDLFTKILLFHGLKDKSQANVAKKIGVSPYFVNEYFDAGRNYPMRKVSQIIHFLHEADVKSKGVGAANQSHEDILKELLFKMMH